VGWWRKTLEEDGFWALIGEMRGSTDTDGIDALSTARGARGRGTAIAFHERLARVLYELDREVLASQPVRFRGDPPGELIPLSADVFLYLRAGIVVAGRETYDAVLADPQLLAAGEWDDCEDLLYVAPEIVGDDIETALSYETGSNLRYWSAPVVPEREDWDSGPRPVIVTLRDLSRPRHGETLHPDGTVAPDLEHSPPAAIDWDLYDSLTVDLARAVVTGGGLPFGADEVDLLEVAIDVGRSWQTRPERVGPAPRPTLGLAAVLQLQVEVPSREVAGWSPAEQHRGLLALAAVAVLAVLPPNHGAADKLTALHAAGKDLLPA
jgi:hypothetical protein